MNYETCYSPHPWLMFGRWKPENQTTQSAFTCLLKDSQAKEAFEYQVFKNELSFKLILGLILLLSDLSNPHHNNTISCYANVGLFHYEIRLVPLSCLLTHTHPCTHKHTHINIRKLYTCDAHTHFIRFPFQNQLIEQVKKLHSRLTEII